MISSQDAHDLFLAAAQIIPALLIALFVAKRMVEPKLDLGADFPVSDSLAKKRQLLKTDLAQQRHRLVEKFLNTKSPEIIPDPDAWRASLEEIDSQLEELLKTETSLESLLPQLSELQTQHAKNYRLYVLVYGTGVAWGIVGELACIWGLMHSAGQRISAWVVVLSLVSILQTLTVHVWRSRVSATEAPGKEDRRLRIYSNIVLVLIFAILTIGFAAIAMRIGGAFGS